MKDMSFSATLIHLSDIHLKAIPNPDIEEVIEKMLKDIKDIKDIKNIKRHSVSTGGNVVAIVISGDLTYSGKKEEFENLEKILINPLKQSLKDEGLITTDEDFKKSLFVVPGNHDANEDERDRKHLDEISQIYNSLKRPDDFELIYDYLNNLDITTKNKVFEPYREFVSRNCSDACKVDSGLPYKVLIPLDENTKLTLIGIDSVWSTPWLRGLNLPSFPGLAVFGSQQENEIKKFLHDPDMKNGIKVVVTHYPFEHLREPDKNFAQDLLEDGSIILVGHTHRSNIEEFKSGGNNKKLISGGVAISGKVKVGNDVQEWIAYNIINLWSEDFTRGSSVPITIYPRRFSSGGKKWVPNVDVLPSSLNNTRYYHKFEYPYRFHLRTLSGSDSVIQRPSSSIIEHNYEVKGLFSNLELAETIKGENNTVVGFNLIYPYDRVFKNKYEKHPPTFITHVVRED